MILKSFNAFSAILSPELSPLNLKAEQERRILMGLYGLAEERMKNEENRLKCLEELKQLGLRLTKYRRLAKLIKNIQESLEKALTICSQLPPSKWTGPAFESSCSMERTRWWRKLAKICKFAPVLCWFRYTSRNAVAKKAGKYGSKVRGIKLDGRTDETVEKEPR